MNKLKLWFEQTAIISFSIFVGILIEGLVYSVFLGDDLSAFSLSWFHILSVILAGAICSVMTILLFIDTNILKNKFTVKIIIHCLSIYLIIVLFGWFFKWFTKLNGFIMVSVIFFLVYAFVWTVSLWIYKRDDNKINKALNGIRDEE